VVLVSVLLILSGLILLILLVNNVLILYHTAFLVLILMLVQPVMLLLIEFLLLANANVNQDISKMDKECVPSALSLVALNAALLIPAQDAMQLITGKKIQKIIAHA